MKVKFIVIYLLFTFLSLNLVSAGPFNATAKTKRIPAGTKLSLELLTPVTTTAAAGTEFSAVILSNNGF